MGSDIGRAIGEAIIGLIAIAAVAGVAFGALVVWGLPKLWAFLKPLIHALTA